MNLDRSDQLSAVPRVFWGHHHEEKPAQSRERGVKGWQMQGTQDGSHGAAADHARRVAVVSRIRQLPAANGISTSRICNTSDEPTVPVGLRASPNSLTINDSGEQELCSLFRLPPSACLPQSKGIRSRSTRAPTPMGFLHLPAERDYPPYHVRVAWTGTGHHVGLWSSKPVGNPLPVSGQTT
jgi:hypothetical protein